MREFADLLPLAREVGEALRARGETVAVGESSSGGLVSAALLAVPGASSYYLGGGVIYTRRARSRIAGIAREEVEGMRSSSEPYALLLARTSRQRLSATWGLSETGAAGPQGNSYGDPAGHSCIAVSGPVERVVTLRTGSDDRVANMHAFAARALALLAEALGSAQR
ncbi:MAG TPA: CinA family protein [Quisquiliibacterium sp.]|nr:CinA family protein [Quisquiliibacterium sp.]